MHSNILFYKNDLALIEMVLIRLTDFEMLQALIKIDVKLPKIVET